METIIIKNGTVFDGSGSEGEQKDILIKEDRIVGIGDYKSKSANMIIDAKDSFVCPGFIDINNDSDHQLTLFTHPEQTSLVKQGITTVIGGNCGSSLAPISAGDLRSIRKWADINTINVDWGTVGELLDCLNNLKIGINFGTLIGHSTVRRGVIGEEMRDLADDEMEQMKFLIQKGLIDGAFGLSTGLEYSHSQLVPQYEILELIKTIKGFNGLYATHLRSEREGLLAAIVEIDELVENVGVEKMPRVEISHLKSFIGIEDELNLGLGIINKLSKGGVDINFDVYPYDISGATLYSYLPSWASKGGFERLITNLKNPLIFKRIAEEVSKKKFNYSKIFISEAANLPFSSGQSLRSISDKRGVSPVDSLLEILILSGGRAMVLETCLSWQRTKDILANELSFITTNDSGKSYEKNDALWPHPRTFGAMPKFLGLVRDEKILSWEKAIYKITGGPAKKIGLKERGLIKENSFADITIFNPNKVNSTASLENPYITPTGIEFVIINGKMALNKDQTTNVLSGKVLRRS